MMSEIVPSSHDSRATDTTPVLFADSPYSLSRGKLVETMKLLRRVGTEMLLPLPKIAVIGNQGAGKSSLIEAISKIDVPRAKGTTTRCPMEVVLTCTKGFEDASYISAGKPGTVPFAMTQNPNEVSLFIRRAQLAILNPGTDSKYFLTLDEAKCEKHVSELSFSSNIVVVEVTDAAVDVTFVDLPGIISHTPKGEDEECIDLIKNLAISYAAQEECLILVTISMEDDLNNQGALKIARDCDPKGGRTKVALTKVDRVQPGHIGYWLDLLRDEDYFITRLHAPDTGGHTQSWADDRKEEKKILQNQPWNQVPKEQKGTKNLREALSRVLATMITARLPTLVNDLEKKLNRVQELVDSLPPSYSDNPQGKLLNLCVEFNACIGECITGSESKPCFFEGLYNEYENLAKEITMTEPKFEIPPKTTEKETLGITVPIMPAEAVLPQPVLLAPVSYPSNSLALEVEPAIQSEIMMTDQQSQVITLQYVRGKIKKKSIRLLPGYTPFSVLVDFINSFVTTWSAICLRSFQAVEILLQKLIENLSKEYFGRFEGSGLLQNIRVVVSAVMRKMAEKTREQIKLVCDLESYRPFTLSDTYLSELREDYLDEFTYRRNQNKSSAHISRRTNTVRDGYGHFLSTSHDEVSDDVLIGQLNARGYRISDIKELARLHGPDEYQIELKVISDVMAYFKIASRRIIDIMPMIFEFVFVRNFGKELVKVMSYNLGLVGNEGVDNCTKYTQDDEDVHRRRMKLAEEKKILLEALKILRAS